MAKVFTQKRPINYKMGTKIQAIYSKGYGDWTISEILFKYEKLEFYDLLNGSMELVFQKIQKWDI